MSVPQCNERKGSGNWIRIANRFSYLPCIRNCACTHTHTSREWESEINSNFIFQPNLWNRLINRKNNLFQLTCENNVTAKGDKLLIENRIE